MPNNEITVVVTDQVVSDFVRIADEMKIMVDEQGNPTAAPRFRARAAAIQILQEYRRNFLIREAQEVARLAAEDGGIV